MPDLIFTVSNLEIEAAATPDRPAKISGVAYGGGALPIDGSKYVIDLAGLSLPPSVPLLRDHENQVGAIVGTVKASIENGTLPIAGTLARGVPAADEVIALSKAGVELAMSVGVEPESQRYISANETIKANGRSFTADSRGLVYVPKSNLREISLVPVGADRTARASIAASSQGKGNQSMSTDGTTTQPASADPVAEIRARAAAESTRVSAIEAMAVKYNNIAPAESATLKAKAIGEGWDTRDAELAFMRADRPKAPAIHASRRDLTPEVLEAAFSRTAGLGNVEKHYRPEILEGSDRFKGMGLQELVLMAAAANGWTGGRTRVTKGNCGEVLQYAMIRASSTYSLPGILSNSANKLLLDGFTATEQSWRQIARIRPVNDFKQATRYRLTADAVYEELPPTGTIKHGTLSEESYTVQARTYAKMFTIDRSSIINDDLGAFDDLKNRLGRGAGLKLNQVFWAAFMDNSTFFTSARGNYQEGSGTALTDAGAALADAEILFSDLTDADGNPLGFQPAILLVPSALSAIAQRLYVSSEIRDTTASTKYPVGNIFQNKYRPVVSSYLNKATYTGHSDKAWYLLADPANLATIEVAFLDGIEAPTVESADTVFDQLGISFRGYHDFGVGLAEWRAGVKSKGEA